MFNVTGTRFKNRVLEAPGLIVVKFYANWCGPCNVLDPIMKEVENLREDVTFYEVNIDTEPRTADKYDVRAVPTVLFFKHGNVVHSFSGLAKKETILEIINDKF